MRNLLRHPRNPYPIERCRQPTTGGHRHLAGIDSDRCIAEAHAADKDAGAAVAQIWQNMTVSQRAEAINEVAAVTVQRASKFGPGFDPTRIDIARRKPGSAPM